MFHFEKIVIASSLILGLVHTSGAAAVRIPAPYDSIATVYPDSGVDQKVRDSLTLKPKRIRLNQAGYRTLEVKDGLAKFYYVGAALAFDVIDTATHASAGGGVLTPKGFKSGTRFSVKASNWAGTVAGGDLRYSLNTTTMRTSIDTADVMEGTLPTTLREGGVYRIVVGGDSSFPFIVSSNVYGMVRDGILKYFGIARSGNGESWFHAASHMKDGAIDTPSVPGAYTGGWYDCGDHLKEPITMTFALATLTTLTATLPDRDADHYDRNQSRTILTGTTDGVPDVLWEARNGAQFFLKNWTRNGRKTAGMVTGVGNFGADHGWWGRPENQDAMSEKGRGGWNERNVARIMGAGSIASQATGLAILSRKWRAYDPKWSDTALMAAKDMYAYAKANITPYTGIAPYGQGTDKAKANLALAAIALLWATHDATYLDDIAYNKTIGPQGGDTFFGNSVFDGGWLASENKFFNMARGTANFDFANMHPLVLYAFHKLILSNADSAKAFGVKSEAERILLGRRTMNALIGCLVAVSGSGASITLPGPEDGGGATRTLSYDPNWFEMHTQQEWVWNRYYIANAAELFFYYDVATDFANGKMGTEFTGKDWKLNDIRQLMVRQLDYQLGVNPWDVSMIMGLGDKNFNHPHHRAANPEGRNTPGALYQYHVPVGALYGGFDPSTGTNIQDSWGDYHHTEVCTDGAAVSLAAVMGLAGAVPVTPPKPTVKVVYVSDTLAQIEVRLDKYGKVVLDYGLSQGTWLKTLPSDSTGVVHKYLIGGLTPATQYFFDVKTTDVFGNSATYTKWDIPLPDGTPYNFTTKAVGVGPAEIENVKVCNVTADSAEIMWYTPDGEHQSSICYGTSPATVTTCLDNIDVSGHPTKFHYVKIGGLTEKTTYWFKVGSDGVWDDNGGAYYKFRTPVRMANFGVYAVQYSWSGMPALGINVVNNEARDYDSLSVRVYVRSQDTLKDAQGNPLTHILSTPTGLVNVPLRFDEAIAARYDICQAYDGAGFNKPCDDPVWGLSWSWSTLNRGVQMLPPVKMPETYDPVTNTTVYYFDLPLGPTMMKQGSRIRFDVMFAARSEYSKTLDAGQVDLIKWVKAFVPTAPTWAVGRTGWYDALDKPLAAHPMGKATQDWSFMAHSVANGDPVDFVGIPEVADQTSANALIDNLSDEMPLNPYMTVYRKGEFVYGFSPSYVEQSTKKTYWGAEVQFSKPFDVPYGTTITLDTTTSLLYVKGVANIYDKLTPAAKGVITDIWVNGVRLSDADMAKAAVQDPATKLWNLNIPVRMAVGGQNVDITIFGGGGTCEDTATSCENGCAFDNGYWFVQFTKGKSTQSSVSILDPLLRPITTELVADSSVVVLEVRDNDNNKAPKAVDAVRVLLRSGKDSVYVTLTETGDSTGVFRSSGVAISSTSGWSAVSVSPAGGDTLWAVYRDVFDSEDSSLARARVKSLWPLPVRGGIFRSCGGAYEARVQFDRAFPGASAPTEYVANGGFETPVGGAAGLQYTTPTVVGDWTFQNVDIIHSSVLSPGSGNQSLDLNNTTKGSIGQTLATPAGATLALSYKYSWNNWSSDGDPDKGAVVLWNGVAIDTFLYTSGAARTWTRRAKTVVSNGNDVIGFKAIAGTSFGMMIDDVSVIGASAGSVALGPDTVVLRAAGGDSLVVPVVGTSTTFDAATKTLTIPLASVPENGARTGKAIVSIPDGSGSYKVLPQALSDSVGPWIDSAKIVENLEGRAVDTIAIWVSEPILAPAKAWFTSVLRANAAVSTASLVVDSAWLSDPLAGQWTVVVRTGTLAAGDKLLLNPALVTDLKGNKAEVCDALWRDLKLWVRQAPVSRAWISDADGDGAPDLATIVYKRALRAGESPESITVLFGMGDSARTVAVTPASGDSILRVPLTVPYSRATTVGSSVTGAGSVALAKSGDAVSAVLADSVAPNLLSANLLYGEGAVDTLILAFSEPLDSVAGASFMQVLRTTAQNLGARGAPVAMSSMVWKFLVDTGSVFPGDSVRPTASGRFVDGSRRSASPTHPWVEVKGVDRAPSFAWYSDRDGDGAVDQITMRWLRAPRSLPGFALLWPSVTGGFDTVRVAAGTWSLQADGVTAILPLVGFDAGVTSSPTTDLGRQINDNAILPFPIYDSVGPVLLSARLSYGADATSFDSVQLVFSEAVALEPATTGILKKVVPEALVPFVSLAGGVGTTWTVPVASFGLMVGDSIRPSSATGFVDNSANRPSAMHRWVALSGAERPPQAAWYTDADGDGAVDHVTVRWAFAPRTRPALSFLWPNGAGGMDSTSVLEGSWTPEADGRTVVLAVGPFAVGVTSSSTTNLGRQVSAGTITGFAIQDSVAAVIMSARVGYASQDGGQDTLHLVWSEPIQWSGLEPLVHVQSRGVAGPVRGIAGSTVVSADRTSGRLLLDPSDSLQTSFRKGDLVRLAPASAGTHADDHGNVVEDPSRWVPVTLGRRPPRFNIVFDPNKIKYENWVIDPGSALQIWVKSSSDKEWIDFQSGMPVSAERVPQGLGPTITLNQPLRGKAILYDNQGTYVADIDLDLLGEAFYTDRVPKDASNQYDVRIQWAGKSQMGSMAASGVYMMRLVLWQNIAAEDESPEYRVVNNIYTLGWEVSTK